MFQYKVLCALFVIAGTYILSKQMLDQAFKIQVNFKYKELPFYLRVAIFIFGDKKRFENGKLWAPEEYPSPEHFSSKQKWQLVAPFIGFLLIVIGTIGAVFV